MIDGNFSISWTEYFVDNGDTVMDIMCGKGDGMQNIYFGKAKKITGVDIYAPYLAKCKARFPDIETVNQDSLEYLKTCADNSTDVVLCIDGIEHIEKDRGYALIKEMKRVAKKRVVIFTPDGLTQNHPHNAWDIAGGDEFQKHKSGWTVPELEAEGFVLENRTKWQNAYDGTDYYSLLVKHEKVQPN